MRNSLETISNLSNLINQNFSGRTEWNALYISKNVWLRWDFELRGCGDFSQTEIKTFISCSHWLPKHQSSLIRVIFIIDHRTTFIAQHTLATRQPTIIFWNQDSDRKWIIYDDNSWTPLFLPRFHPDRWVTWIIRRCSKKYRYKQPSSILRRKFYFNYLEN